MCDTRGTRLVDRILRFEQLRTDISLLLEPRGLSAEEFRSNPARNLEEYFNQEQLDLVSDLYSQDFARFSYSHR